MGEDELILLREDEALNAEILVALLRDCGDPDDVDSITNKIYNKGNGRTISKPEMHILSNTLRHHNVKETLKEKAWIGWVTDGAAYAVFVFLSVVFLWLTFDHQSRASVELGIHPIVVLGLSSVIIFLVSLLEGSQIAIVNITDKDISGIAQQYPHAYDIQKITRSQEAMQDYLTGRQLLVVTLVIIFSLLTSFPNIENSIGGIPIPSIIIFIGFKLGILNAMILLWLGQLIPQLLAAKAPLFMLNTRLMKGVVYLCLYISYLKIAKPSSLIVKLADVKEEKPPMSEYEHFIKDAEVHRHYVDNYSVVVEFGERNNVVKSNRKYIFRGDVDRVIKRTLEVDGPVKGYAPEKAAVVDQHNTSVPILESGTTPVKTGTSVHFHSVITLQDSSFRKGDEVEFVDQIEFDEVRKINIKVKNPTRVLFIKCIYPEQEAGQPIQIKHFNLDVASYDPTSEEYRMEQALQLPEETVDGSRVATYAVLFPALNTSYSISWK